MSALPSDPPDAVPGDAVPGQDETHQRMHELLSTVISVVLEEQPALHAFHDHRPERDRSSGNSWHGLQTLCHVSALLVSAGPPAEPTEATARLVEAAHGIAAAHGMQRRAELGGHGMTTARWTNQAGDLLEVVVGVRVAVRAISAPFLPGSLTPMATTSPSSPLSPPSPPPRLVR